VTPAVPPAVPPADPALFAYLRRKRVYRAISAVLVAMACFAFPASVAQADGLAVGLGLLAVVVVVAAGSTLFLVMREARVLARFGQTMPHAWVRVASVYRLRQDVVMAVEGDRIAVIGYDGVPVATWDRQEMASVEAVAIPSTWPARPGLLIRFGVPEVPPVVVAFTAYAGISAPPAWASEALAVLRSAGT
jgi:hypothetical protein